MDAGYSKLRDSNLIEYIASKNFEDMKTLTSSAANTFVA
jgi:hypothetical protein